MQWHKALMNLARVRWPGNMSDSVSTRFCSLRWKEQQLTRLREMTGSDTEKTNSCSGLTLASRCPWSSLSLFSSDGQENILKSHGLRQRLSLTKCIGGQGTEVAVIPPRIIVAAVSSLCSISAPAWSQSVGDSLSLTSLIWSLPTG